jgi:hypothetical protein
MAKRAVLARARDAGQESDAQMRAVVRHLVGSFHEGL